MHTPLKNRVTIAAAAAALALTVAGCSSPDTGEGAADDDTFDVLFVGGLTGPTAAAGQATERALDAAAESINEDGGVDGKKLVVEYKDDQGDPTKAVSVLQDELADGKPDVVIPSGTSAEALAMLPVLTREKIVTINFGASPLLNDPGQYPYHFQSTPSSAAQLIGLRPHLEQAGVSKLGVLVSDDEYGDGVISAIQSQLKGSDIKVEATKFTPTDVDLRVPYQRMLDGKPDFVYLDTTGDAAVRLLEARTQVGAVDLPTIAGSGMSLTAGGPYKYGSPEANKNLEILVFKVEVAQPESEQSAAFKDFIKRYTAQGPVDTSLSTPSLAWDQLNLVTKAASEDGALDDYPDSLVQAIYDLDVPEGTWLTEKEFGYSADTHSPTPQPEDFPFIPSSPMENGQYHVASGS